MTYRLGKLPARRNAVQLRLMDYLDKSFLPPVPTLFGHQRLVSAWGMMANDSVGDCVFAGAAHETMVWTASAGRPVKFTDAAVLSDYSAVTGFDPKDPNTDQGTDMQQAASYRLKTGVVDAAGKRHKIGAYLALNPGNITELTAAAYIFGAVGVGIQFPQSAMDQFDAGREWTVKAGSPIEGGHYVSAVGRVNATGALAVVTWGRIQLVDPNFFRRYCDEAVAYLSTEFMTNGKSPEGFDMTQLKADLAAVAKA